MFDMKHHGGAVDHTVSIYGGNMKLRLFLFILFFVFTSCTTAKIKNNGGYAPSPVEPSIDYESEIELAQSVGRMLYILDKASAIGTDVMIENVSNFREKNLGGYVTFREADEEGNPADSYLVSFYTNEEPPKIKYGIHVGMNNKHKFIEHTPPIETTSSVRELIKARQAAIKAIPEITQPINPVILPSDIFEKKGHAIYLLAGTTEPDTAVFGKHYRAFVDPDNDYAVEIEPLSYSALLMPLHMKNGEKPEALNVSQIMTNWPTEVHVFANLLYNIRIYVITKIGLWRVVDGKISYLGKIEDLKKKLN